MNKLYKQGKVENKETKKEQKEKIIRNCIIEERQKVNKERKKQKKFLKNEKLHKRGNVERKQTKKAHKKRGGAEEIA